jgi:WD40 repeat protein
MLSHLSSFSKRKNSTTTTTTTTTNKSSSTILIKQLKSIINKLETTGLVNNDIINLHHWLQSTTSSGLQLLKDLLAIKKVFISYAQAQTPNEPKEIISRNPSAFFRDADNLQDVHTIPVEVAISKYLIMVMSPYSIKEVEINPICKYGLTSRLFCLVELISAQQHQIPIIPLEIKRNEQLPMVIPKTLQETETLLKSEDWIVLQQVTGCENPIQAVFDALVMVDKQRQAENVVVWESSSHDASIFEQGLKKLFDKVGVEYGDVTTTTDQSIPTNNKSIATVIYGPDAETEAVQFAHEANKTFPESGQALLLPNNNQTMEQLVPLTKTVLVWITTGLCTNEQAMKAIIKAQQLDKIIISILLKTPGTKDFDFVIPSKEIVPGTKQALQRLFPIVAKPLHILGALETVKVQTRAIWSALGLDASLKDELLKEIPDVGDKYQIAVQKHLDFVVGTRQWVFIQIDDWIKKMMASKSAAFAIVGVGGMGKSVMAGELAFRGSTIIRRLCDSTDTGNLPYNVVALHFFKHDDKGKNDPKLAIGSLSRQLANNVEGFRIALQESLDKIVDKSKEFSDLETLFLKTVVEPAGAVKEQKDETKLVIIDALDECGTSSSKEKEQFLKVITKLWPKMPPNYGLILTSRPDDGVTSNDLFHVEFLKQTEDHNKHDLQAYVRAKLVDELFISGSDAVKVSELVAERADGLFIFARLVIGKLLDLAKDKKLLLKDAETLPKGMDDLYVDYFSRFKDSVGGDGNKYARILSTIVVAREPMPLRVWREVVLGNSNTNSKSSTSESELERQFTTEVLIPTAKLLDTSNGTVKVLHKTMLDFLVGSKAKSNALGINEDEGHALLAGACERLYQDYLDKGGGKIRICTPINAVEYQFGVRHAAFHSVKGNVNDYGVKWFTELERIFHWLNGGIQNDDSRYTTMLEDGDLVVQKLDSSNLNGDQMCEIIVDDLRLAKKALLIDSRLLGCEILGKVISTEWEDGTIAQERVHLRLQAEQFIERIRQEEKIKVAQPIGSLSGMDEAGTSLKMVWQGHEDWVMCVSNSKDGTKVVSGSSDQTVRVWDSVTGKELKKFSGHENGVNSVSFSPDGLHIVSGSADKSIRIWDYETGKELKKLEGHSDKVNSVCYSRDGTLIASGSYDKTIHIWDSNTGKELKILNGHTECVYSVCFSPINNNQLASASWDKTVRVWDVVNAKELKLLKGHSDGVRCVCFSPDGTRIASGSYDETIIIWNSTTSDIIAKLKGHSNTVTSVCFSPNGTTIASGSNDTVIIWESNTNELIEVFDRSGSVLSVCFSHDGTYINSSSEDNMICVWDASRAKEFKKFEMEHSREIWCICLSQDGTLVASASSDKTICIWDSSSGKQLRKLEGQDRMVWSISFSLDGSLLVSGSHDGTRIWDVKTGKNLNIMKGSVNSVCFSPDGLQVASGSGDGTIRLWDTQSGQEINLLKGHSRSVLCICYSPDGMKIASGSASEDKTVRIWECITGKELMKFEGHQSSVTNVCCSPDGKRLVSSSDDETVKIWNLITGQILKSLKCNYKVDFSPDGLYLISSSTEHCWDANSFLPVDNVLSRVDVTAIFSNFVSCRLPLKARSMAFMENAQVGFFIPRSSREWITTYNKTTNSWIACGSRDNLVCIYEWR